MLVGVSPAPGEAARCQPFACTDAPLASGIGPGLRLVTDATDDLRLVWPDVPDATLFELWRSADRDFSTAELVGTFTTTEHAETNGMLDEVSWYYRVRAVNDCGWAPH
jgi:predicted phage tail protein